MKKEETGQYDIVTSSYSFQRNDITKNPDLLLIILCNSKYSHTIRMMIIPLP